MATYTCGDCGRKGHNRRSCRNSTTTSIPKPPALSSTKPPAKPVADNITVEEIQTWWALANGGKNGKQETVTETYKTWSWNRKKSDWNSEDTKKLFSMLTVAVQEGASEKALKKFLKSFGADAKKNIASQPDLPETIALILAHDTSSGVKCSLAGRTDLGENVGKVLAHDKNYEVRTTLAQFSTLPAVLAETYDTKESLPRPHADTYFRRIKKLSEGRLENFLAKNPHLPDNLHKVFLRSPYIRTMNSALSNSNTSPETLLQVWRSPDITSSTQNTILRHGATPTLILKEQTRTLCSISHLTHSQAMKLVAISANMSTPIDEILAITARIQKRPTPCSANEKDYILRVARNTLLKRGHI